MKSFKNFLYEKKSTEALLKAYVSKIVADFHIKITSSSRGDFHIRFPMDGEVKDFKKILSKFGLNVKESDKHISSKFNTFELITTKKVDGIPKGSKLFWVNNSIKTAKGGAQLFNNKDLTPDALGLAGSELNKSQIIKKVSSAVNTKYDSHIANQLIELMKLSDSKQDVISLDAKKFKFSNKDLAKVSADFGEILSGIWALKNLNFKKISYPLASNERLIDFYGVDSNGNQSPISVKSGGGGKVSTQNILDSIKSNIKTSSKTFNKEKSISIFKIVNENPARAQMIKLHQFMQTPAIKKLGNIIGVNYNEITMDVLKDYFKGKSSSKINKELAPFWKSLNMNLTDKVKNASDKMRLVISPLGESIWKILNNDKEIKKSLSSIARNVTLMQVNVDVKTNKIIFKANKFKDAEFEFGWAGYAAGNKLGFKMKLVK